MRVNDQFVLPVFRSATPYVVKVEAFPADDPLSDVGGLPLAAKAVLTLDVAGEPRAIPIDRGKTRHDAARALQLSEADVDSLYITDSGQQGWAALKQLSVRLIDDRACRRYAFLSNSVALIYACEDGALLAPGDAVDDEMLAIAYRRGAGGLCGIAHVLFAMTGEERPLLRSEVLRCPQRALNMPPLKSTVHYMFHEREVLMRAELQPLADAHRAREGAAERLGERRAKAAQLAQPAQQTPSQEPTTPSGGLIAAPDAGAFSTIEMTDAQC